MARSLRPANLVPADVGRKVVLRWMGRDPQLPWQVFDAETGLYLSGFPDEPSAAAYIRAQGWTVTNIGRC